MPNGLKQVIEKALCRPKQNIIKVGNWICFGYITENETINGTIKNITENKITVEICGVLLEYSKNDIFVLMCQE